MKVVFDTNAFVVPFLVPGGDVEQALLQARLGGYLELTVNGVIP